MRKKGFNYTKVTALDRSQLRIRNSIYTLHVVVEALDLSYDELPMNKSSIQKFYIQMRKK